MAKPQGRHIVKRIPKRGVYERDVINAILDEGMICHVSFVVDGQPFMIPTIHARDGNNVLLHGLKGGRMLNHIEAGHDVCIAVTLLDGLVLARSAFHHSMNYRSVVLYGKGTEITEPDAKMAAMKRFVDHLTPGRWDYLRPVSDKEIKATSIVSISMDDVGAKIRTGPVSDDEEDYELPIWAGVMPLSLTAATVEDDSRLDSSVEQPEHVKNFDVANRQTRT
ncbi:MAG: pyridoxamine 5'-phosphate oxidase family protein [Gammaproteobacteria bacterium]